MRSSTTAPYRNNSTTRGGRSGSTQPRREYRGRGDRLPIIPPKRPSSTTRAAFEAKTVQLPGPLALANLAPEGKEVDPRDWPFWRGPEYNGVSRETGLIDDFDPDGGEGSNVLWKREDLGGRSTPITLGGRLYTLVRNNPESAIEGEKVVCVDLATGKTLWENEFNVWLSDVPDTRVGWSSVVADPDTGNVFALGVCGYFQCINGETGKTVWSLPLHERFGLLSTYGGRTNFPVICEDLVIISSVVIGWGDMAKPAHRFVAFNKHSGEVVWMNGTRLLPYDTTYSSPTVTVINGQKAMVFGSSDGDIWALQPRTGQPIWNYKFSRRGLNVSPLVVGDNVYSGHSEENVVGSLMGAVVAINGATGTGNITASGEEWKHEEVMMGKSSPIAIGDRLYCFDDRAKCHVYNRKSGMPVAKMVRLGTVMRASPLYADGKIYANTANGRWYVLEPDDVKGVAILQKGRFPSGEECHASPIASHGKVIVQTTGTLYCFQDPEKESGIEPQPEPPKESPVADDMTPAFVQVVPAEVLMRPGAEQDFKARLFNAKGQLLGDADATFEVEGSAGEIDETGKFVAKADAAHVAVVVKATAGDLTGIARVRIVPDLPWTFDFEDMDDPPVTWVGARYRHVIREVDGSKVMVKVTTIPKGTRSRCWFGHPELSNYTIQADVRGAIEEGKLPDIGITNQGYALDLQGANQKLQARTWVTQLRMAETIDFPWKPNTWYRMKLSVSVADGKATVQGKVWPRDEDEPAEWTITAIDESPNLSGSPGLFGNAKDAELYLDNITVTPN